MDEERQMRTDRTVNADRGGKVNTDSLCTYTPAVEDSLKLVFVLHIL